jgi:hypothetical protein
MPFKRKIRIDPATLAELLLTELVDSTAAAPANAKYDPALAPALRAATRLYQYTSVLMILLKEESKQPEFLQVRAHLERLWTSSSSVPEAVLVGDVRSAMQDLSVLLTSSENRHLSWARQWLARVGIQEFNPVRLHLVGIQWMDFFIVVTKSLRKFRVIESRPVKGA